MKKTIVIIFMIFLASCSSSDNDSVDTQTASIIGIWSYTYPSLQCTEIYTFNANNSFTIVSGGETVSGDYSFTSQKNSSDRHAITLNVKSDNQQFDCQGSNSNDIGVTIKSFLQFVNPSTINWYDQASGGTPLITTTKNIDSSNGVTTNGLIIFVTKNSHVGDYANDPTLTGNTAIDKADSFCNIDENKPNNSVYKALLTDGITRDAVSLTDWVLSPNTTYYRSYGNVEIGTTTNNAIFAALFTNLTNSISIQQPNTSFTDENIVVTGINNASTFATTPSFTCNSWSNATNSFSSGWGLIYETNENAFVVNGFISCAYRSRLYCVEQP